MIEHPFPQPLQIRRPQKTGCAPAPEGGGGRAGRGLHCQLGLHRTKVRIDPGFGGSLLIEMTEVTGTRAEGNVKVNPQFGGFAFCLQNHVWCG